MSERALVLHKTSHSNFQRSSLMSVPKPSMMFSWLTEKGILAMNPAREVNLRPKGSVGPKAKNIILYGQYVLIPFPQLCTSADKRPVKGHPPQRRWCITWPQFDPGL